MNTLSIDQASIKSGYAIFKGNELVNYDTIKLAPKDPFEDRLIALQDVITCLIKDNDISNVVFEGVQAQSNISTYGKLSRIVGMLEGVCHAHSTSYTVLNPSEWRSMLDMRQGSGVKRKELKEQDILYVKNNNGLIVNDDIADAICIGLAYLKGAGLW